ncbi:GRB2-associated-binding protein 1-like [Anoplopoma fimbria]|uniref:GRB2-associated-binding protein 1-like n=1 Tax=Anoplopoma fimbria TaxID=229290 RepID=UPI0023EBE761|nr:GRB2-associated-binding protein 1-like [Anoplopoma fimbria]
MSVAGEVVCEGWLRKSPPEKKLRRYAWKRRWFVLRSGRLSGEPDVLQYFKNQQSRRPIRTINLNLCEQVDAGLTFTKKELESSFVFDLRTQERTWYLVAESEEDMNRWVSSICLLCGFNPTDDVPERPPVSGSSSIPAMTMGSGIATATGSVPPPYDPVNVRNLLHDVNAEEDYLWLSHCQSHIRPPLGSSTSLETDSNDNPLPSSSSSSSSSPSLHPNGIPLLSSSGFRTATWTAASMPGPLSQSLDASLTFDPKRRAGRPRCHPSPHPRKHSLDFHLRPVAIPLSDDTHSTVYPNMHSYTTSGYQIPRPASTTQPRPPRRPSSTPSVDSLTQAELHASTPTPPPRPPKPQSAAAQGEGSAVGSWSATLPRSTSELDRRDGGVEGGGLPRSNTITASGRTPTGCDSFHIPQSLSDRASMFEFSESFNSYFFNKGMVPLGSVCTEADDVDENYVPMSAATTEPPVAPRVPPHPPSDPSLQLQDANYVPMIPLTPSLPVHSTPAVGDLASLGRQVPPPAHMGFRNSPLSPVAPLTPPLRRNTMNTAGGVKVEATPPPIHRNLKPQRRVVGVGQPAERTDVQTAAETTHKKRVKPAPLDINPVQQEWQEVPPPVRSPVTRTFTRDPSSCRSVRPTSAHSSSPSSDSDDTDDSYIAMTTTPTFSLSAGEPSLRLMLHRASEGGVSSPMIRRARGDKQVEYLDLDLHTGRSTLTRQKRCTAEGGGGSEQAGAGEERARGERTRVEYVVVDPKRTKALRSTREAWHDGRMSTEKEKC